MMVTYMLVAIAFLVVSFDLTNCLEDQTCSEEDNNCRVQPRECGVWYAKSNLPGDAGIGMFAGKDYAIGDLFEAGDLTIPIVDIDMHQGRGWKFLWNAYNWNAGLVQMDSLARQVDVASPGFGSVANSFLDLQNVQLHIPDYGQEGLHRSKSPGAGAITPYHNRSSYVQDNIMAGQEIFVSYGDKWFLRRAKRMGPLPISGDLPRAEKLIRRWNTIRSRHNDSIGDGPFKVFWERLVLARRDDLGEKSRILHALPKSWDEVEYVLHHSLIDLRKRQSTRSFEWLNQHGICADNLKEGPSTISDAGRGAFASRPLSMGTLVAPLPMIHIPFRERLNMYSKDSQAKTVLDRSQTNVVTQQLLLNYCFGHRHSTVLLCPYGSHTGLVNHSQEKPNVRLQWSDPMRSTHLPELLKATVDDLLGRPKPGLTMEMVALRDIEEGEEILLDYGPDWQEAWDQHVKTWKPHKNATKYHSGVDMNRRDEPLQTIEEEKTNPYPNNVVLYFDKAFIRRELWADFIGNIAEYKEQVIGDLVKCKILASKRKSSGEYSYDVVYLEGKKTVFHEDMPREAFLFRDKPYTNDIFLPNAFRHDIRIPDDLLPETWMNLR